MTSNIGSQVIKELSQDYDAMEREVGRSWRAHSGPSS